MEHKVIAELTEEEFVRLERYTHGITAIQETINDLIARRAVLEKDKQSLIDGLKKKHGITENQKWHINTAEGTIKEGHA